MHRVDFVGNGEDEHSKGFQKSLISVMSCSVEKHAVQDTYLVTLR